MTPSPSTSSLLTKTVVLVIMGMCSAFSILRSIPKNHRNWHPSPLSSSKRQRLNKEEEEEECLLIPETNPDFNPNATSLSGVSYSRVISGIDALYPPYELSNRNAQSRTDGYWKYVERGEKPPQEFTYGEFDIEFFGALLDISWKHYLEGQHNEQQLSPTSNPWINKTFCDIGSGAGRLVVTAAALHPEWELCRGIEILPNLHNISASIADGCRVYSEESNNVHHILRIRRNEQGENSPTNTNECHDDDHLPLAPIKFTCGSFTDPYEYLGDIDCAFVFSSCMKPDLVRQLSLAIGRQCKPGTIIITTEFPLFLRGAIDPFEEDESIPHGQYEIQLLEKIDGWCWLLGGKSTAYIHRVKSSLWEEYAGPREMQQLTLEEDAFRLVQSIENGELTDTKAFLRRVRNDMIFHGVPHEFLPPEIADDHPESNSATDEEE
ncbi:hypothetical protein ACHAXR_010441 [Thalassiosira sp. AJA248-18]